MTRYGIPYYRMPAAMLDRDVDVITALGVGIQYDTRIGKDVTMQQLQSEYDAVVLTIGLWMGRSTRVPGSDHKKVTRAVDLLRDVAAGVKITVPRSAVVIGGGNVAMDIARTLARLQKQKYGEVQVTLTALEDLDHFLADPDEIKESREEGMRDPGRPGSPGDPGGQDQGQGVEDLAGALHLRRPGALRPQLR